jgi:hypothetical protein
MNKQRESIYSLRRSCSTEQIHITGGRRLVDTRGYLMTVARSWPRHRSAATRRRHDPRVGLEAPEARREIFGSTTPERRSTSTQHARR